MIYESTLVLKGTQKTFDDVLNVTIFDKQPVGAKMLRDGLLPDDLAVYSDLKDHPTIPYIKEAAGNHIVTKGSIIQTHKWGETELITQDTLDAFWDILQNTTDGKRIELLESSAENKVFSFRAHFPSGVGSWSDFPLVYTLNTSFVELQVTSDETDIVCLVLVNGRQGWTRQVVDVMPSETFEVQNNGTEFCYVVFGQDITSGAVELTGLKPYRLSNNSVIVTNNSNEPCRIIRMSK